MSNDRYESPGSGSTLDMGRFGTQFEQLVTNVATIIRGKDEAIRLALICLISDGHLLIEDVPGVGKTSLAKAIAESLDGSLSRIQFTPDLLPTDVTGVQIYNRTSSKFEFHPGSVFANVVLGDEINRASPKTQSALLEVMEERQVTVDGVPHAVPEPFMVIATQNPIEQEGTYPLPEAQLDRFMMRISLGYPDRRSELEVITELTSRTNRPQVSAVMDTEEFRLMSLACEAVHLGPPVAQYILDIVDATRDQRVLRLGASPRGSVALAKTTRALAASDGRSFVVPEDVKKLAPYVLTHRLLLTPEAELQGVRVDNLVHQVLDGVAVPQIHD